MKDTIEMDEKMMSDMEAITLATALGVPVKPVPPPGTHPDEELMAPCAAFDAAERKYLSFYAGPGRIEDDNEREAKLEPVERERERFVRVVSDLRATALEGYLARVRVIMLENWNWILPSMRSLGSSVKLSPAPSSATWRSRQVLGNRHEHRP